MPIGLNFLHSRTKSPSKSEGIQDELHISYPQKPNHLQPCDFLRAVRCNSSVLLRIPNWVCLANKPPLDLSRVVLTLAKSRGSERNWKSKVGSDDKPDVPWKVHVIFV